MPATTPFLKESGLYSFYDLGPVINYEGQSVASTFRLFDEDEMNWDLTGGLESNGPPAGSWSPSSVGNDDGRADMQALPEPAVSVEPPNPASSPDNGYIGHDWGDIFNKEPIEGFNDLEMCGRSVYERDVRAFEVKSTPPASFPSKSVGKRKPNLSLVEPVPSTRKPYHFEDWITKTPKAADRPCKKQKMAANEPEALFDNIDTEQDDIPEGTDDGEKIDNEVVDNEENGDSDFGIPTTKKRSHKKKARANTNPARVLTDGPAAASTLAVTGTSTNARRAHMTVARRCPACLRGRIRCDPSHPGAVAFKSR